VTFGSIAYLNLLPFQVYLKRALPHSQLQQSIRYRRGAPSTINRAFKKGSIHAAFISSIESRNCRCTDLGIIANGPVYSVFVLPGEDESDAESATSNTLATLLGLHGKVIIGDKALQAYLSGVKGIDLSERWKERTGLPFVFARLCYNAHAKQIEALASGFARTQTKIPQTVLKKEARKRGITPAQLLWYLQHIQYRLDHRSKRSLARFLRESRRIRKR
jgi:chorismate dehydratase